MNRSGYKYLLLLAVLGIFSIVSVFRLNKPPVFSPEYNIVNASRISAASPSHRYQDDVIRGDDVQKAVTRDIARFRKECSDKKWALEIVHSSDGFFKMDDRTCKKLPTQQEVSVLYGDDPVVYGMETCEQFRNNVQQVQSEANYRERAVPTVRVAGLFNTGTNAMAVSLARNLEQDYQLWDDKVRTKFARKRDQLFNVPWEKHVPLRFRDGNVVVQDQGIDFRLVLPVVLVRDPYWWMQSMVRLATFSRLYRCVFQVVGAEWKMSSFIL